MESNNDIREATEAVAFWLDPQNASARKELEQRNPILGEWLQMIECKVNEKLAQAEQEVNMKA